MHFVPRAITTVTAKEYKSYGGVHEYDLLVPCDSDNYDFVYKIKGITAKGLRLAVTLHNAIIAGKCEIYDKGKAPAELYMK